MHSKQLLSIYSVEKRRSCVCRPTAIFLSYVMYTLQNITSIRVRRQDTIPETHSDKGDLHDALYVPSLHPCYANIHMTQSYILAVEVFYAKGWTCNGWQNEWLLVYKHLSTCGHPNVRDVNWWNDQSQNVLQSSVVAMHRRRNQKEVKSNYANTAIRSMLNISKTRAQRCAKLVDKVNIARAFWAGATNNINLLSLTYIAYQFRYILSSLAG